MLPGSARVGIACLPAGDARAGETQVDIAAWLRGLGLERYEQTFRDHELDGEVLARLTADDLKAAGTAAVGHRRRLLDAIAARLPGLDAVIEAGDEESGQAREAQSAGEAPAGRRGGASRSPARHQRRSFAPESLTVTFLAGCGRSILEPR